MYGQGNFLFNYASHGSLGGQGLGVVVNFPVSGSASVELHPIRQSTDGVGVRVCSAEEKRVILEGLRERSAHLTDETHYTHIWESWCESQRNSYLTKLFGLGKWFGRINRGGWIFKLLTPKALVNLYNVVSCESHRATFREGLDLELNRGRDRHQRGPWS